MQGSTTIAPASAPNTTIGSGAGTGGGKAIARLPAPQQQLTAGSSSNNTATASSAPGSAQATAPPQQQRQPTLRSAAIAAALQPGAVATAPAPPLVAVSAPFPTTTTQSPPQQQKPTAPSPAPTPIAKPQQQMPTPQQSPAAQPQQQQTHPPLSSPQQQQEVVPAQVQQQPISPQQQQSQQQQTPQSAPQQQNQQRQPVQYQQHAAPVPPPRPQQQATAPAPPAAPQAVQYQQLPPSQQQQHQQVSAPAPQLHPPLQVQHQHQPKPATLAPQPQQVKYQQPPSAQPQHPTQQMQYQQQQQQQPPEQLPTASTPPQQVQYHQQQPPPPQQIEHQQQMAAPSSQPVQYQQQPPPAQPQQPQQHPVPPQQPVQGQPPLQKHYPHQGLNGGWQSDKDVAERRKMIAKIVHLLQQRKPNAPKEWLKKLPQMAKRLEESLYRSAKSFAEYNDATTLKQRLQQLAVNIGMKTRKLQQAQLAQRKQQAQHQKQVPQPPPQQQQNQYQQQLQYQQQQSPPQQQQPPQQVQYQQPAQPQQPPPQKVQYQQQPQVAPAPVPLQQPHMHAPPPSQSSQIVNMSDINPIMSRSPAHPVQTSSAAGTSTQVPAQVQYQQMQSAPAAQAAAQQPSASSSSGDQRNGRHVSDRQQVLRHQQQRLLLLRHAAKCQHEDGRCPVTPHCAGMKRLWKHIAECKDQKCLVPHCVSSRYVLSHYHRCKDVRCPVCGPVREAIHRSHEKQKQMQALKQRHQAAVQESAPQPQQATSDAVPGKLPGSGLPAKTGVVPVLSGEPANKRRKSNSAPVSYQQYPQPIQPQPLAQQTGLPGQPVHKAGYVYSHSASPPGAPGASKSEQARAPPGIAYSNGQVIMPKHSGPKPQEDHTLINCFTIEEIETHIKSLNKGLQLAPQKLKSKCLENLKVLQSHQHGWVFNSPVDPIELGLPDYFQVIKRPMDLGTIKKRLENGCYHSINDFENDVNTTFDNAMLYNPEGSVVYNMAKEMKSKFTMDYENLIRQLSEEEEAKRKNGEACLLCGCERLLFEPAVFYCNGLNCSSKRIRRNSYYYVGGNNQYHWCHQCFGELKDGFAIDLGDASIKKEELTKKKNDEVHEESWVQCDKCERWIHQICGLFNTRQNKDQRSEYCCPRCTIEERKKKKTIEGTSTTPMAEELPRTKLSEFLEAHVREKVDKYFENQAKEKAAAKNIPLEEAKKDLHMGGPITIRQVTSMDRKLEVRDRMKRRYAYKNYPDEFTFRCKCIVVFQKLDGVDVILFGLYVYEHDENNPAPNTRTVYVSYLDSVHYMRPRSMRTFIYHEILIAYLDYVRKKGFLSAHIWACPPLKGDDYILYAKPEDQKTPKDERLRQWYLDMLVEAQKRSIVGKLTNMYDLYFKDEQNDATIVPYMDGDYFPAEVENIIKDIEEGKTGKKDKSAGKKKKGSGSKAKTKKKNSGRGGTRSTGLDADTLAASGIIPPAYDIRSLQEGSRDFVMAKLGDTIRPMKESFIVAYLNSENAKPENKVVAKAIQECREKLAAAEKEKRRKIKGANDSKKEETLKAKNSEKLNPEVKKENNAIPTPKDIKPCKNESEEKKDASEARDKPGEKKYGSGLSGKPEEKKDDPDIPKDHATPSSSTPEKAANKGEKEDADSTTTRTPTSDPKADAANEFKDAPSPKSADKQKSSGEVIAGDKTYDARKNSTAPENSSKTPGTTQITVPSDTTITDKPNPPDTAAIATVKTEPTDKNFDAATTTTPTATDTTKVPKTESSDSSGTVTDRTGSDPDAGAAPEKENDKDQVALQRSEGKFAAMAARNKRDFDRNAKESKIVEKNTEKKPERLTVKDSKGRIVKVIDDDAEEMDCEFLNNRQAFLNLCQGNHYQFDQLRRAKHTSMMVLWHLHNRDAPKFVQQCASCSREILTGYRYHCPTCADYDQCQDCVSNPNTPRHPHLLKPIPVASGQHSELTEEQRKERQRSIQLHMTLLQHAATCNSSKCPSANCTKMKGLLKHGQQCQIKATGGCHVCKRIWALLQLHARQCKASTCPVPNCIAIRERFRQLKKQQQAMDDRRRQEMNRHYRSMGAR